MISGASEKLFLKNRDVTCFFVTHSLAVIRFLPLVAMGKHQVCAGEIDEHLDVFLDLRATRNAVIRSDIAIFQYLKVTFISGYKYLRFSTRVHLAGTDLAVLTCKSFYSCNCHNISDEDIDT